MSKTYTSKSGRIEIQVADDAMSAWMTIHKSGKLIDEKELTDLIDEIGIKYGMDSALKKMSNEGIEKDYEIPFPLAICIAGKAPKAVNYHFESKFTDPEKLSVDSLDELTCVTIDTVLADFSFNLFEGEGSIYNIFGEMLVDANLDPASAKNLGGEGVYFDDLNSRYIAARAGYPYINSEGQICVLDTIRISSDLTGVSIKTHAGMIIKGSIRHCLLISGSSINVAGSMEESEVYCEGDLNVTGNIQGCYDKYVHVLGDVNCKAILDSRLITKSRVLFTDTIRNSIVIAEKGIVGKNSTCVLYSGNFQASGSIVTGFLGNQDSESIDVEITISAYYKNLLMIKTKELIKLKQNHDTDIEQINQLSDEIKELENDLDMDMSRFLKEDRHEKLRIKTEQIAYPNTNIRVLKHSYQIKSVQNAPEFVEKD